MKNSWKDVTREDVIKAIYIFNEENPNYPAPRNTFLIYEGKKYPAKHIRGMAYKEHYNKEISKNDYTGGQETYDFFTQRGFEVQYTPYHIDKKVSSVKKPAKTATKSVQKEESITSTKTENKEPTRIYIPVKGVIEQKNALQLLLNKIYDGDIVCEKTFVWMKTPDELDDVYTKLSKDLKAYRGHDRLAKKRVTLRCDFVCQSKKIIIEYDERQHFSEARRISLLSYKDIPLHYDRDMWINACNDISARDNNPIDRDEVRAYYDSTRDIEAYRNGYTLIRIMHGQIDFEAEGAMDELKKLLKNWTISTDK